MNHIRSFVPLLFLLVCTAAPAIGQAVQWDPQQVELSRAELEALLTNYEQAAASEAYSRSLREEARREGALIRGRLADGDFQVGDQIALVVEGEEALTSTFMVQSGPVLVLPEVGPIPLSGVLRSELEEHLRIALARFIRDPVVQARSSVRLMITGAVGKGGYHVIATNTVFSDILMITGGPSQNARLEEIRVERGGRVIWQGNALQQAIIQGRTLDQLSMRAGDHVVVPEQKTGGLTRTLQTVGMIVSPIALLAGILVSLF